MADEHKPTGGPEEEGSEEASEEGADETLDENSGNAGESGTEDVAADGQSGDGGPQTDAAGAGGSEDSEAARPDDESAPAPETGPDDELAPPSQSGSVGGSVPSTPTSSIDETKRWRFSGKTAALAACGAVAVAAVVVGAVWAVRAIVDDGDRRRGAIDEAYWTSDDDKGKRDGDFDDQRSSKGEWRERFERGDKGREGRRGGPADGKQYDRDDRADGKEPGEESHEESAGAGGEYSAERCRPLLRLGGGEDAPTLLICNLPEGAMREAEREDFGELFGFRGSPRAPLLFGVPGLEWFDGGGWPLSDRGKGPQWFKGDGWSFGGPGFDWFEGDGWSLDEGGREQWRFDRAPAPLDRDGRPFDGDLREFFGDGRRFEGSPFGGDLGELFGEGSLDELSDEQRQQLEQMMEFFEGLGFGDLLEEMFESVVPAIDLPETTGA